MSALSVLLVEDQPDIAESLRMVLTLCGGYDISVAADGQLGIDMALANPPDAVICDIGLPKKNGFEVATELSRRLPRKPLLIAISGYSWENSAKRALDAGFNHYFAKPADPDRLHVLLQSHRLKKANSE
jgi:two-component system, sensor histidine kinase